MSAPIRIALIDNYDSYTHNLAHLFAIANQGQLPVTILSDTFTDLSQLIQVHGFFHAFILSPGPGNPMNTTDFSPIQHQILSSTYPVFAVCLGHQALCNSKGAFIQPLSSGPAHGIVSTITQSPAASKCPLFKGLPKSFSAVRYHSLAVNVTNLQSSVIPTAWAIDLNGPGHISVSVLMAVRHQVFPQFGVQFHPESVCSNLGDKLAYNFVSVATRLRNASTCPSLFPSTSSPPFKSVLPKSFRFRSLVRKIPNNQVDPYSLFSAIFASREGSFWLDSGVMDTSLVCNHCHRAIEKNQSAPGIPCSNKRRVQRNGPVSIMGACDGPHSELITYDVSKQVVAIRQSCASSDRPVIVEWNGSIFDYIKQELRFRRAKFPDELPYDMNGGYVGYFGYESKLDIQGVCGNKHKSRLPDAWFVFADRLILFDHANNNIFILALVTINNDHELKLAYKWFDHIEHQLTILTLYNRHSCWGSNLSQNTQQQLCKFPLNFIPERRRKDYLTDISKCLEAIEAGESYEVCLTNRLYTTVPQEIHFDALEFYGVLRTLNTAPYSAFLYLSKTDAICCSSPERFLTIKSDGKVESKPIKGTRRRGQNAQEDDKLRYELETSAKDRSENLMIVDLVRNDLSKSCSVGTVQVPKLMHVESYATVHQLVSTVTAQLEDGADTIDCIKAAYPMGSMTGAPKIRTMEIIDSTERSARGIYSGTIGYLSVSGAADLNVVIRTAVIRDKRIEIGVGGAIISKSCPEEEYEETILKGRALMQAIALHTTGHRDSYIIEHEPCLTKVKCHRHNVEANQDKLFNEHHVVRG